ELRLRVAARHLPAAERHPLGEQPVLELVLLLDERGRDEPALARLAQPVEQLALLPGRALLGLTQRLELLPAEEVGVAAHDLRLLGRLLLAHAYRAPLLVALVEVARETLLEFRRRANRGDRQSRRTLADQAPRSRDERGGIEGLGEHVVGAVAVLRRIGAPGDDDDRDARAAQLPEQDV